MTDQGFNTYFNLIDNFTAKFDAIQKRITSVTRDKYVVDFTVSNDAVTQTQGIGKKIQESVAGINNAVLGSGATDGILQKTQESANKTANSMTKVGTETSKSTSALDKMRTKMGDMTGLADKLSDKFGIFTATLTSGAVAGIAWLKAFDSAAISESIYRKLERKNVDTERLQEFVAEASGMGYTTKGQRRDIADVVLSRTKMRSTQSEEFTLNIEKLYAQEEEYLNRMGVVSSADLADMLTRKTLGRGEKRILEDIGISSGSVSSRARGVAKVTEGVTAEELVKGDPLLVLNNRLDEFSSKMGKTMIEPMNMLLSVVIRVLDVIDRIPGAPNLVAIGMVLASAAGATSLLVTVLSPLGGIYTRLTGLLVANTTATATNTGSQVANAGASNVSIIAKTRLAAANIYASVATRAHTLATIINRATAMASVGAIAALAVIHGILTGSITLTTAATWALNVALAVLDTLNPFTYLAIGALILAGILGIIAYKSGILGTVWKDLSKIKFGKVFDDLMEGDFDSAWKRLSKGMAIAWEDVKGDITLKFGGNFETIVNYVRMLVSLASRMFPVHAKALGVLTDTQSVFGWMYSLWKSFWSWLGSVLNTLISAFPGGKKLLAKSEWEEAMEKSGITYSEGKYYQSEPTAITTWDDALKKWTNYEAGHGAEVTPSKDILALQARYEGEKGFFESLPGIDELNTTIDEIKKVFQGVSDRFDSFVDTLTKFKDSIVSQFSNFINKITNAVPWYNNEGGEIDKAKILDTLKSARTDDGERLFDFQDETLMAAIEEAITGVPQEVGNLTKPAKYARAVNKAKELINKPDYRTEGAAAPSTVEKLTGLAESLTSGGAELLTNVGIPTAVTTPTSPVYWNKMGEGITADEFTELSPGERTSGNWIYDAFRKILPESEESNAKSYTNGKETISPKAWGTLDSDQKEHWIPQYAVGATFKKDGLFAGRVHAPEEIIPQATAQRGAGPIARALDTLYGVTSSGRASSGSQKTEIHIHEHNDFSGMRVSSAIDVDKLMRDIERKIRGGSISAVRKQIEQGRT